MPKQFTKVHENLADAEDKHRQWADALRAAASILDTGPPVPLGLSETAESSARLESALWRIVDVAGEIATDPSVEQAAAIRFTGKGFRIEPRDGWESYVSGRTQSELADDAD